MSAHTQTQPRMIRDTRQRRAIRDALEAARRPLSALEVLDAARAHAPGLGIATVYRTLNALVEEGAIHPVDLPGEAPRYEVTGQGHHHHFQCRKCGGVYTARGCPGDLRKLTPRGFRLEAHEVILYGLCCDCVAAS
jgi:Fur family ferric uptake transcriptional regulator